MDIAFDRFTPGSAALGGALIGLSASLLLLSHGRVAGISGILGSLLSPRASDRAWRALFLVGLIGGGLPLFWLFPSALAVETNVSWPVVIVAGLLVGFGARLGSGCTSGHGVCGISRLSPRSLAATGTFMVTAMVTTFIVHHLLGSAS
ncbi:MAG: YeeE/YedE family protein [Polyangiaceae bacterium]|nr:YeeE/YedE family protein [Polyangiaceae bacterium]